MGDGVGFGIRKAVAGDIPDIARIHVDSWQVAYRGIVPHDVLENLSVEKRAQHLERHMLRDDHGYYVALLNRVVVGFFLMCVVDVEAGETVGEISAIYIDEACWGKGFGSKMLEVALGQFRMAGVREIYVWVLEENRRARGFYEKCGFMYDGEVKVIHVGKPLNECRYRKSLRGVGDEQGGSSR